MPNTPSTQFNERVLNSNSVVDTLGIGAVIGLTEGGPLNRPDLLIESWPQYQQIYGGEMESNEFPTLCRRALEAGAKLRISSVKHLTDVNTPSTLDATKSTVLTNLTYTLSAALTTGKTISFDPWAGSAYTTTQAFSGSALSTLNAFAAKLKSVYKTLIADVIVNSSTLLTIIPQPGADVSDFTITCGGSGAPTITEGTALLGYDSAGTPVQLFSITPKYYGNYSKLRVEITAPSNGSAFSFNLKVYRADAPTQPEIYKNITVQSVVDTAATYLSALDGSMLVSYAYEDLSAYVGLPKPAYGVFHFGTGSVGSALTDVDLIGVNGLRSGIYAFNGISDILDISFMKGVGPLADQALANYAATRKDVTAIHFIPNTEDTANEVVAYRTTMGIDSSYSVAVFGGLTVVDALKPNTTPIPTKDISSLGDVLGVSATSAVQAGAHFSPSGLTRGKIKNAVGVVNNHLFDSAEYLAQNQINIVTNQDGIKYLWHSFTMQTAENALSYWNVRRMLISLKKALAKIVKPYHEEPNDIPTWLAMYNEAKPTLDDLVTARAIFSWDWYGDQFAGSLSDLKVNNESDVRAGKYKARLVIKEVVSLQEITIDIELSPTGASFEEVI